MNKLPVLGRSQWCTKANLQFLSPSQFVTSSLVQHPVVTFVIGHHNQWWKILECLALCNDVHVKKFDARLGNVQSGRVYTEGEGVPQMESRWEERMLAALESFSRRTFPKKASSLLTKYFSMESSCCEFLASSIFNF